MTDRTAWMLSMPSAVGWEYVRLPSPIFRKRLHLIFCSSDFWLYCLHLSISKGWYKATSFSTSAVGMRALIRCLEPGFVWHLSSVAFCHEFLLLILYFQCSSFSVVLPNLSWDTQPYGPLIKWVLQDLLNKHKSIRESQTLVPDGVLPKTEQLFMWLLYSEILLVGGLSFPCQIFWCDRSLFCIQAVFAHFWTTRL